MFPLQCSFLHLQSFPHRLRASQARHLPQSASPGPALSKIQIEDNVKKLKSPKTSPGPALSKTQIDSAVEHLADWVYESCGIVSFSSLEHPKFRAFLNQVGLPPCRVSHILSDVKQRRGYLWETVRIWGE
ncbi:unnamed protein product [Linum trigynum]|uniref:Uncharacterized protein n=1 Tax=Linum trigynum TaxID=586398 RepID=A0AAV2GJV2_9ROSI